MAGALGALGSLAGGFVIKSGQDRQDARDAARDAEFEELGKKRCFQLCLVLNA